MGLYTWSLGEDLKGAGYIENIEELVIVYISYVCSTIHSA